MGLTFSEQASGGDFKTKAEAEFLQALGCKACPLNDTPGKIDATGAKRPLIYVLGEAAGAQEEDERRQFVGKAGRLLRRLIPREAITDVRWNNTLNCHPPKNRDPTPHELQCCKPRVIGDIERSKPKVIWGFGNVPLHWISGFTTISQWRGRRMPVRVGNHTCWYYPFMHPSFLAREARDNGSDYGSENERMTAFDLERAYAELDNLPEPIVHTPEMARANVKCITDIDQIRDALQWASRQPAVGLDYETNRVRPYEKGAKILTASVGTMEKSYAFPMQHPGAGYSKKQLAEIFELWTRFLLNAPCKKLVHSLTFELEWSGYFFGKETLRARPWEDTLNAALTLDERTGGERSHKKGPLSLAFLVQQYFGFDVKKVSSVDTSNLEFTPLEVVLGYNGIDSKYHYGLWEKLWERLEQEGMYYAYNLARRRAPTVVLSQLKGVPVDQDNVKSLAVKYGNKIKAAEKQIASLSIIKKFERQRGTEFSAFSSKDLPYVFDTMLGCEEVWVTDKRSKKEKLSTEEEVLDKIIANHQPSSDAHKLAKALIDLREANGTKSKYVDALAVGYKKSVIFPDGLIHANFNFWPETGRLSSNFPNLQNFPKRDAETKEVRRSIVAPPGHLICSFDYGQIEARVIAMLTKDKVFCKALWERFDVHQDWAERLAYAYPDRIGGRKMLAEWKSKTETGKKVMKDFRTDIKNEWTFPLFFGATDQSVSNYLKIPLEIIKDQVNEFWKMFPTVKAWQEKLIEFYQEYGYVECLTGRRRRGPLNDNQIINSPVQGTAAEIVEDAMGRLSEKEDDEIQPEINIHDDLTFIRVPVNRVDIVAEKVIGEMISVPFKWVNVPIAVEMSIGKNWCDLNSKDEDGKDYVFFSDTWGR